MTIRDDILRVLRASDDGMTDAQLASRLGKLHQQVNQRCRQLAQEGLVVRDDSSGVIVNRLASGSSVAAEASTSAPGPVAPPASEGAAGAAQAEWSWEGNVQAAVVAHLAREGWSVTRVADTASQERGVDVIAERGGKRLLVEVKGWPSRLYVRGERAGQLKPTQPTLQAKHWFAEALLAALRLREKHAGNEVAMAFPDMPRYRTLVAETRGSLSACGIGVLFVSESGEVTAVAPEPPQ